MKTGVGTYGQEYLTGDKVRDIGRTGDASTPVHRELYKDERPLTICNQEQRQHNFSNSMNKFD